jgi:urease accessory protein
VTITFVKRLSGLPQNEANFTLSLTAEDRQRSRHPFKSDRGDDVYLNLPRGTSLRDGDWLEAETGELAQVKAKPEPVFTITASSSLELLKAAYHLGNRHVPLEITDIYLRLSPDPVLKDLLEHRGLNVIEEIAPFQPETGAYGHSH